MKNRQQGAVLAVSLILVVVASMLGVAGMGSSQLGERVAGNQRQVAEAFMAAETGISEGIAWLKNGGNTTETRSGWTQPNRVSWTVGFSPCIKQIIKISSTGTVTATQIDRNINVDYARACADTSPIVMLGQVETFYGATSDAFTVFGKAKTDQDGNVITDQDGNVIYSGSAIQVDDINSLELILIDLTNKNRIDNYYGGFELINCDPNDTTTDGKTFNDLISDPTYKDIPIACTPKKEVNEITSILEDPEKLSLFIAALKASQTAENKGTAPGDMGIIGDCTAEDLAKIEAGEEVNCIRTISKITFFDPCSGLPDCPTPTLNLSGNDSGAGILVVEGNLAINGTPSFYGLIIVTGTSFTVKGGGSGGVLGGSIIFANPLEDVDGNWTFGDAVAEFDFDISGGGKMTFQHDQEALDQAAELMNTDAKSLWTFGKKPDESEDISENQKTKITNWNSPSTY